MFKKKKNVIYKSNENQKDNNQIFTKAITIILPSCVFIFAISILALYPFINISIPTIYMNNIIWIVLFSISFILSIISLMIVTNQGANKKLFIIYGLCCLFLVLNLIFAHILYLFIPSLFLATFLLYFAFLCLHELKKTNLIAHNLFLPFIFLVIYNLIIYYFILMLN